MAARSLRLTASARCPIASGGTNARSKWTPSTSVSTLKTSRRFRSGSTTAASSPMPTASHDGCWGRREAIRAISSRSVRSATQAPPAASFRIVDRSRLANHGDFDLSRILELVLDSACDVLREPHGFLVRDLFALYHDANLTAGLQSERF